MMVVHFIRLKDQRDRDDERREREREGDRKKGLNEVSGSVFESVMYSNEVNLECECRCRKIET